MILSRGPQHPSARRPLRRPAPLSGARGRALQWRRGQPPPPRHPAFDFPPPRRGRRGAARYRVSDDMAEHSIGFGWIGGFSLPSAVLDRFHCDQFLFIFVTTPIHTFRLIFFGRETSLRADSPGPRPHRLGVWRNMCLRIWFVDFCCCFVRRVGFLTRYFFLGGGLED